MQRNRAAHIGDKTDNLRHQISHQKHHHGADHEGHESGVHQQLLGFGGQFILPFERIDDFLQNIGQLPRAFPSAYQIGDQFGENTGVGGEGLRDGRAGIYFFIKIGTQIFDLGGFRRIAQIAENGEYRYARAEQHFELE